MHLHPYVAVVDDDKAMCRALVRLLRSSDFEVAAFHLGSDALDAMDRREPDCFVIDIELPDSTGLELFHGIHRALPRVPVIVITAWEDDDLRAKAMASGAAGFFYKPFSDDVFLHTVHTSIAQHREASFRPILPPPRKGSGESRAG